jgi:hypothetical protein
MAQTCLNTVAPSLPFELQRGRVLTRAQSGVTGREITARTRLKRAAALIEFLRGSRAISSFSGDEF